MTMSSRTGRVAASQNADVLQKARYRKEPVGLDKEWVLMLERAASRRVRVASQRDP